MGPSDHYLAWRLRRGDRQACRDLIRRYHQAVYGYLRRLSGDASLAEDLTQETYARAWRHIQTLRECASLRSWLLTIARNEFLQWARVRRPNVAAFEMLPEGEDETPGAEAALLLSERDRSVRRAVERLDPAMREVVALHYFQDFSLREIGAVLGIPAGTVKSRVHRALASLRALLDQEEADHEGQRTRKAIAGHP